MDREARAEQRTSQEHAIASALRRLNARSRASTCTAYFLTADHRALTPAMTVDTRLSFAIPVSFDTDDLTWPIVRAYTSGKTLAAAELQLQRGLAPLKSSVSLAIPFLLPLSVACAPIRTETHSYGALNLRWIPPREIERDELEFLEQVASELASKLEVLDAQGADITAPSVPVFIPGDDVETWQGPEPWLGPPSSSTATIAAERGISLYQLQRLATELGTALSVEDVLVVAQDRVVRPFGGRAFAVWLLERERLHVVGASGLAREVIHEMDDIPLADHSPETDAMNNARVRFFPSAQAVEQAYPDSRLGGEQGAVGYFPLLLGGAAVGCCMIEFSESRERLSPVEATLLTFMLERVGQSFARARSGEVENALTRSIQRSLLPRSFPHIPGIVATARYFSVTEGIDVGGDWYDMLTLPDGRIGLVVGDVEGHNLEAASVMGQMLSGVRALAAEGHEPAEVLRRSNRLLLGLEPGLYATCCCMWFDLETGVATAASAGHPAPFVAIGPEVRQPELASEPPLGVDPMAEYQQSTFKIRPGAVIALFTDGLLPSRQVGDNEALEELGRALAGCAAGDLEVHADDVIRRRRDEYGFDDDVALVLLRYEGVQPGATADVARMSVQRDDLHGVAGVRDFLHNQLDRWDLEPAQDDVQVMASEVVTNSLIHAHSAVDIRLRKYKDRVRVEVQDSDPSPPIPTALLEDEAGNEEAEGGRGLLIVDVLASAWGSSPAGRGKITWFEVRSASEA